MKKFILTAMAFALVANVSAQLKVDAAGNTHATGNIYLESTSNFLGTTSNVPITFKVNGVLAGSTGRSGNYNVSFGYSALYHNTTGSHNTANGYGSLSGNTTGNYNTAIGTYTLYSNTTGANNTAIGYSALDANTTGSHNIATGYLTLYNNTMGNYNIATGTCALYYNTTGNYNTANGRYALYSNTTGSYNTALGYLANATGNNLSNTTAIGYSTTPTSNNQVRIGNSSVTSIGGYAGWTNLSDGRTNKNIRTDVPGLAFINGLQPVTYNLDLDAIGDLLKIDKTKKTGEEELSQELIDINKKARETKEKQLQTGFIAQDVEKTAQSIGYDFSGVDVDEAGIYGLRYAEFVVPLVKAVQELSEQNDRLQAQVNELAELVYNLQGKDADP
ncbi:MAG: tail fiber domain-containing protein, partial [Prevotellaceae bacterium]|nr:tail fiber domain-containing protein [Prevotellaceae bacterium]